MKMSRRALMMCAGVAAWELALPLRRTFAELGTKEYRLTAKQAVANLTGDGYPDTAVWVYDGTVPGPEVRVRQGEPVRIMVRQQARRGHDRPLAWHPPAERDGRRARPDATADPARRELRLRIHAARCRHVLVSPARRQPATAWPRAGRRVDRRGTRAGRGRPRPVCGSSRTGGSTARAGSRPASATKWKPAMSGRIGNTVTINGRVAQLRAREGRRAHAAAAGQRGAGADHGLRFEGHRPVIVAHRRPALRSA